MDQELILEGKKYISSKRLAGETGYASDYISRLCRDNKIDGKLVGRNWYVNLDSLMAHQDEANEKKKNYPQLKHASTPKTLEKSNENITSRISDTTDIPLNPNDLWDNYLMADHLNAVQDDKENYAEKLKITIENIEAQESKKTLSVPKDTINNIKVFDRKDIQSKTPVTISANKTNYKKIFSLGVMLVMLSSALFFARKDVLEAFLAITEQKIQIENTASIGR